MLKQQLIDLLNQVRRTQMNSGDRLRPFQTFEDQQFYSDISCHLLEVCDWINNQECKIQKSTKLLAKTYCDIYLDKLRSSRQLFNPEMNDLLIFTSIRLAIKFNENSQISDLYTMNFFLTHSQTQFTYDEIFNFQTQFLITLGFKLKISTAYDLAPLAQLLVPLISEKQVKKVIPLIDFGLSLTQFSKLSATEIFFSCLLVQAYKILNKDQFAYACQLVQAVIGNRYTWQQIQRSSDILCQNLNTLIDFNR